MYLKINGTDVTNNLFQFQITKHLVFFFFRVIPLMSHALFHSSLYLFNELMEGFIWDVPRSCRYASLSGLHTFKTRALTFGKKTEKVTRYKIKYI